MERLSGQPPELNVGKMLISAIGRAMGSKSKGQRSITSLWRATDFGEVHKAAIQSAEDQGVLYIPSHQRYAASEIRSRAIRMSPEARQRIINAEFGLD